METTARGNRKPFGAHNPSGTFLAEAVARLGMQSVARHHGDWRAGPLRRFQEIITALFITDLRVSQDR